MIARLLSRYADASLHAELDRTRQQRDNYRNLACAIAVRLKAARAANVALAADLAEEQAEHQATGRRQRLAAERVEHLQQQIQETHQ